jgi:hypothetical protein
MRSTRRLASGTLLVAILATLAGAAEPAAASTGAVPNPSFEDGWRDSKLACWGLSGSGSGRLTLTRNGHSRLAAYARGNGPTDAQLTLATDRTPACRTEVSPGSLLQLQFWLKSTAGARPVVSVWSAKSGWKNWYTGNKFAAAPLRRYSVTLPAIPLGITAVSVGVAFDATSTVILDDVALTPPTGQLLFAPRFPTVNGLITNEFAYWSPADPRHVDSPVWELTSGSLFAYNGGGYTGVPDDRSTDALSRSSTGSAIFRLTTRAHSFGNVSVQTKLKVRRLLTTRSTPRVDWDGTHLFLRYKSQYQLYYASVARRDSKVVIKKKCPGGSSNNGTYYPLTAEIPGHPIPFNAWQAVGATVRDNNDGSVTMVLYLDGKVAAKATDKGVGCAPLTGSGAVGIRGDNAEFQFNDYRVTALD